MKDKMIPKVVIPTISYNGLIIWMSKIYLMWLKTILF